MLKKVFKKKYIILNINMDFEKKLAKIQYEKKLDKIEYEKK